MPLSKHNIAKIYGPNDLSRTIRHTQYIRANSPNAFTKILAYPKLRYIYCAITIKPVVYCQHAYTFKYLIIKQPLICKSSYIIERLYKLNIIYTFCFSLNDYIVS